MILLVEDRLDDVASSLRTLRRNGVIEDIVVACDAPEALDWLFARGVHAARDPSELPAMVLLGLQRSSADVETVLQAIRAEHHTMQVPVIVLTSAPRELASREGAHVGPVAYLDRPIEFARLVDAATHLGIDDVLSRRPS